jgi:large subunit ribosomal protein L25
VKEIPLQANLRSTRGRAAANALRRSGRVPGVFYQRHQEHFAFDVKLLDLRPLVYTSETHIIDLQLSDGSSRKCVMKEVQFDPVTDIVSHFDLMGLVEGEKIRVEVPIVLLGTAVGVRNGGVLNHLMHKLEVECLPQDMPEHISVDISHLDVGDILTVGELSVENVHVYAEADVPVVMIGHSRHEEAAAATTPTEEAPSEPEVIARGKGEDEG